MSNRTAATAADITVGAIVYKGKGNTAYRVLSSRALFGSVHVELVKATTTAKTGSRTPLSLLTVDR